MSVKVMGMVWDIDLPPSEKLVLLAYADHADHDGNNIYPAIATIARKTGYKERNVQRITRVLEGKGLLIPRGGQRGGVGITAHWSIPKGANFAPLKDERVHSTVKKGAPGCTPWVHPDAPDSSFNHQESSSLQESATMTIPEALKHEAPRMFEKAFGFGELPWSTSGVWERFERFIAAIHSKDATAFGRYVVWRGTEGKYSGFSNRKIRENPQAFMDTGWPEFEAFEQTQQDHKPKVIGQAENGDTLVQYPDGVISQVAGDWWFGKDD